MYKVILICLLASLFFGTANSQEYRGIIRLEIPKTCPVTTDTVYMLWVDSCVKAKISFSKEIFKIEYQVPPELTTLFINTCQEEYRKEDLIQIAK